MGGIRDGRHSPLSFRYDRGKAFTPNKILWPELKRPGVARPGIFFGHNERFGDRTRRRKIIEGVQPQRRLDRRFALKAAITQALSSLRRQCAHRSQGAIA